MSDSSAHNKIKICRHGVMVFNPRDLYVGRSLDLYGEFAEAEIDLLSRVVAPGSVVLDVGACIGTHTLPLARAAGPDGVVHAFEPQRLLFQTLCANLALNSVTTVHAYHAAAGVRSGTLFAPRVDPRLAANYAGLSLRAEPPGETVRVMTIDGMGLDRLDLIKIDVEGMEREVLEGAGGTVVRLRPVLYIENDRNERSDALVSCIGSFGYEMFWHTPRLFNPANFLKRQENVFGDTASLNLLCLPKGGRWKPDDFEGLEGFSAAPVPMPAA